MSKQSSNRNYSTCKRLWRKNRLQVILLVAVSIWLMYRLGQAYSKRRPVALALEINGELIRRHRLGRKGLVESAGNASQKDAPVISGRGTVSGGWKSMPGKGAREGQEDEDGYGFSGFDYGDDIDLHFHGQNGAESNELDTGVRPAKPCVGAQEGAAVEVVTGAADGIGMNLESSTVTALTAATPS